MNRFTKFYIGSEEVKNNTATWYFSSDGAADIKINGLYISIKRR